MVLNAPHFISTLYLQDVGVLSLGKEQKQSLNKQLHIGEPLPIQEKQESEQNVTQFEVPKVVGKAADEKFVSDDTLVVKKSIERGKPTLPLEQVGYYF